MLITEGRNLPSAFLLKHCDYHYTSIRVESDHVITWLDSRKRKPINLSILELHTLFKREFADKMSSAALYCLDCFQESKQTEDMKAMIVSEDKIINNSQFQQNEQSALREKSESSNFNEVHNSRQATGNYG